MRKIHILVVLLLYISTQSHVGYGQCTPPVSNWPDTGGYYGYNAFVDGSYHRGIDIKQPVGSIVYAINNGTVTLQVSIQVMQV